MTKKRIVVTVDPIVDADDERLWIWTAQISRRTEMLTSGWFKTHHGCRSNAEHVMADYIRDDVEIVWKDKKEKP